MNILILGADGFLGRHLEAACWAAGHRVMRGVHGPSRAGDVAVDFRQDTLPERWRPRLRGVDAVINAVGILRERRPGDFQRIHDQAPRALFAACDRAGVARVVQISALGAETRLTPYLASKRRAEEALLESLPEGVVVRPSLVFGADGASSRFFLALAAWPLLLLADGGRQRVQPVHVEDLCWAILRLLEDGPPAERIVPLVGPSPISFAGMIAAYRRALGHAPARIISLPGVLMPSLARMIGWLPGSLLTRDTWSMLAAGNVGNPAEITRLLGHPPRAVEEFVDAALAIKWKARAGRRLWRGGARLALSLLWLGSAIASLVSWPLSLNLLAPLGLSGAAAWSVLIAAVGLDALLGVLTLVRPGPRLWVLQGATILAYSMLVALWLPVYWFHPFAPMLKNLPVLALLAALTLDRETAT